MVYWPITIHWIYYDHDQQLTDPSSSTQHVIDRRNDRQRHQPLLLLCIGGSRRSGKGGKAKQFQGRAFVKALSISLPFPLYSPLVRHRFEVFPWREFFLFEWHPARLCNVVVYRWHGPATTSNNLCNLLIALVNDLSNYFYYIWLLMIVSLMAGRSRSSQWRRDCFPSYQVSCRENGLLYSTTPSRKWIIHDRAMIFATIPILSHNNS